MTADFAFLGTGTADAWDEWAFDNAVNDAGTVRLRRERLPAYVDPAAIVELPATASPVVDLDVDDCDVLYLLRESGDIDRVDPDTGRLDRLGCEAVGPAGAPARALSVTSDTIYVAGGPGPEAQGFVTAIARYLEQPRWTSTVAAVTPVAMARDEDRVFVLSAGGAGGYLATVEPDGGLPAVVEGVPAPVDLAIDESGTAHLLSDPGERPVLREVETTPLDPASPIVAPEARDVAVPTGATCLAAGRRGEVLVGRHAGATGEGTLFRVGSRAPRPLANLETDLDRLHLAASLYGVEAGGRVVHSFDPRARFARHDGTGEHDARLVRAFDSGEQATTWHRVTLGFSVAEPGTQVRLSYAATDDPVGRADVRWRAVGPANPHDALLEEAVGRYLWLRIELQGGRFATPRVHALRAYFPRRSYLRHLPAIYQDDPESRAFLERFLSIFESAFVGVEEDLSRLTQYLDPVGVPPAFLGWLEDWLAIDPDETWPDAARRELLERAPELFKQRGTPSGLLSMLSLYLRHVADPSPAWEALLDHQLEAVDERDELSPADARTLRRRIESDVFLLEYSDLDCATGPAREPLERLLGCPQCFFVFVRPFVTDGEFETVQGLVDETRPAHAVGRAVELEPSIVLGGHAYLGINSVLPDRELVVGEGSLGLDSVLDAREAAGQVGVRSRTGVDTELS